MIAGLLLSAVQIVAAPPAKADVVNLVCGGINYWIDSDKKTITFTVTGNGPVTYPQLPVTIDDQTYSYHPNGPGNVTIQIDRTTGAMSAVTARGVTSVGSCAKGSEPKPQPKL